MLDMSLFVVGSRGGEVLAGGRKCVCEGKKEKRGRGRERERGGRKKRLLKHMVS